MSKFPIIVERLKKDQALKLACGDCDHAWDAVNPDAFMGNVNHGTCPKCGSFDTMGAYEPGAKCPNCGKLDYEFSDALNHHCSRACMLQSEYKTSLEGKP